MDRRSGTRNLSFGPAHVGAVFSQQHPESTVQGLREALLSAITQIKSLEVENKALKEQAGLMESRQMEVSQLQEELKQKDNLLKREIKKRRARTRAHVDTLVLLTQKEKELKRSEEEWRRTCDVLETSLISKTNQLQKITLNKKKQKQWVKKVKKEQEEDTMKEKEQEENEMKSKKEKEKMEKEQIEKANKYGKETMEKEQREKEKKYWKERMEKEKREKEKKYGRERMDNKQNETEMRSSEEKEMNDKKTQSRRGGVTSRRWVQTDRHQYRGRNCWFNSSQTPAGDDYY